MMKYVSSYDQEVWSYVHCPFNELLEIPVRVFTPCFKAVLRIAQMQICSVNEAESLQTV